MEGRREERVPAVEVYFDGDDLVIGRRRYPLTTVDLNEAPDWGFSLLGQVVAYAVRGPTCPTKIRLVSGAWVDLGYIDREFVMEIFRRAGQAQAAHPGEYRCTWCGHRGRSSRLAAGYPDQCPICETALTPLSEQPGTPP